MAYDVLLGALLGSFLRVRPESIPEEVPLAPIDFATLRTLSGRAPVEAPEAPRPGYIETLVPLRRAA